MTEPIKLKVAGDKHTMEVARCRLLPFGNDPEIEYEGRDGTKVWMPKASSDRQLTRLNLTMESVVGHRVTIKRDANSTKGRPAFWGIYLEDGNGKQNGGTGGTSGAATAALQPATSALEGHTAAPAQPTPQPAPDKPHVIYEKITAWVLKDIVPMYEAAGVTMTDRGVAAIVNTLFINRLG